MGLVSPEAGDGSRLVNGRYETSVTDRQIQELGIRVTPQHPETELRKYGSNFESESAFREVFATHVVVDRDIVTGQNQNSGHATSHRILEILAGQLA